ncbi:cation-transporting P-type ATPase [Amycolatopsis sp. FDAARGOS 1241]|uniref:cation-translocating P-type ATPase n=1 Tax=Amycolatopsis sp. FDAARGOS 1241 TaxID=2778070 RepID=UPI00195266DE|nr:cation-transporting P-type ATPase [Amycolatopsis sp. FDAARGOS 1241]QRP50285.1 cation-transporting P-type ATPase [Amycolatopsis sp. FDAARGOS 1241]
MTAHSGQAGQIQATGPAEPAAAWHALSAEAVLDRLKSGPNGLPAAERARRLDRFGPNTPIRRKPEPWWHELAESFTEPLQLLLIAVAVLSAIFGELRDAIAIGTVVAVVAVVETFTELRATRAIATLRAMTAPTARLVREDGVVQVPAAELVPGDVLVVEAGDVLPADARVLASHGLRVDESSLTGESAPAGKSAHPVPAPTELAERSSLLHSGSPVHAGAGRAVVVATGAATELGRLGKLVAGTKEPPTPLQIALSQLAKAVLVVAIAASVLVPAVGLLAGQPWREMLLSGLTLAFATVPEELPILITLLLAIGGRQLARRGALLRRLRAGETLGAVTTVVTDKTGTLTENHLQLAEIIGNRHEVLAVALACQPTHATRREPLEVELASAAEEAGLAGSGREIAVFPFDPARKLVSRVHTLGDDLDAGLGVAVSGAPETVLDRCDVDLLTRQEAEDAVARLSERGLRVIAFARRTLSTAPTDREQAEHGLTYVGLAAFDDPLRPGVPEAIAALTGAGVATIVVTGDHSATATAIALRAGLPAGHTLSGTAVDTMADAELDARLEHGSVIARATPATKHRIVRLLQHRREVVAVTGDGANDAPALAAADVGIALGRRSAELARTTAGLILTNDAYPTVVDATATGRNITAQLRRAVAFYLGAKLALVVVLLAALAAGLPSPFQPVHIVLLEIFMDLGATVAFVAEPTAPQAMHHPPRPPGARFLDRTVLTAIAITAATLTLAVLPAYLILTAAGAGAAEASAGAVFAWLAAHVLIAWTLRTRPLLTWKTNPAFPAWAAVAVLTGLAATTTSFSSLLHLGTLAPMQLSVAVGLVLVATLVAAAVGRLARFRARL